MLAQFGAVLEVLLRFGAVLEVLAQFGAMLVVLAQFGVIGVLAQLSIYPLSENLLQNPLGLLQVGRTILEILEPRPKQLQQLQ